MKKKQTVPTTLSRRSSNPQDSAHTEPHTGKGSASAELGEDHDVPPDLSHIANQLWPLAVRCDSLTLDPANARRHPQQNLEAIKGSLKCFKQDKPIVVRQENMVVCCGNGTLECARALGWEWIAATIEPMTDVQFAARSIADNRTSDLSDFDQEALDVLLATVKVDDAGFQAMFDELKTMTPPALVEDEAPIDRADELQKKWQTATGQFWEIPSKTAPPRKVAICPNCQHKNRVQP